MLGGPACGSSGRELITIGPCLAMGSLRGLPEASRNRIPSPGLNRHLIVTVEDSERAMANAFAEQGIASSQATRQWRGADWNVPPSHA